MKSTSSRTYADCTASAFAGLVLVLLLAFSTYLAGYFLLPNKSGLYRGEWQFELFKPAMHAQRWLTRQDVSSGYIDSAEMHWSKTLPYPPLNTSRMRSLPLPIPGDAPPGTPTPSAFYPTVYVRP